EWPRLARDALAVIVPFALRQLHVRSVPDSRAPENSILDLLRAKIGQRRVQRPVGRPPRRRARAARSAANYTPRSAGVRTPTVTILTSRRFFATPHEAERD